MPLPLHLVAGVRSVATLRPDPDQARSWVERELSRPEYQQDPFTRFLGWLHHLWLQLQRSALDASLAKRQLGWEPRHSLDEGLAETWAWISST